jgi:4-cresol dehydrogenase (hydroxylating)
MVTSPIFLGTEDAEKSALLDQPGGGSAADWDRYAAAKGLHFWETELRFFGPPRVMAAQWEHAKERFSAISGVQFEQGPMMRFPLTEDQISRLGDLASLGIPSLNVFTSLGLAMKTESKPITGHLDASPIVPFSGAALLEAYRVFARLFREAGVKRSLGFAISYHWRSFIMFQGMQLSHDREHNARVRATYQKVVQVAAEHGWGTYRTHIAFMDEVANTYSYNDNALLHLHETLKDALDPNGILAAGRYGIWPKNLRRNRA